MSRFIKLDRPLAFIDIESTGTNVYVDRIVELAIVVLSTDNERRCHVYRVNPGIPIPAEVTRIHGITDAQVANCPPFPELAPRIAATLEGCDLSGYNLIRFDIPILIEEFRRAQVDIDLQTRRVFDAQRIFHRMEPRDLSSAVKFYCGREHTGAHGAEADALATLAVLEGQYARYPELPLDPDELHRFCSLRRPGSVDAAGRLKWVNREVTINFGRRRGELLRDIVKNDPSFLKWMLNTDFPSDTKDIIRAAMRGEWPTQSPEEE